MSNTKHFPSFSVVNGHVKVQVDLTRFDKQFQEAQFWLEGQVMNDMIPYMPFRDGIMVDATRVRSASMQVTDTPLKFDRTAHPSATDHWFDAAKAAHGKEWVKGVKKRAGGG